MREFFQAQSGNVAVIFAISIVPIIALAGASIDYALGVKYRARLASAADAAALVGATSAVQSSSAGNSDSSAIASAINQANSFFVGAMAGTSALTTQPPTISVVRVGNDFTSQVTYAATSRTFFSAFTKQAILSLGGSAAASAGLPPYFSYYLLLDVSGSMGVPSTTAGQARLAQINPDQRAQYPSGCYFACHFAGSQGYDLSRTNGTGTRVANDFCLQPGLSTCIQLRIDAVAYAVQQLLQTAQNAQVTPNQFSMGLFPFITNGQVYQPLTTSLSSIDATHLTSLLDNGTSPNVAGFVGSGGTHFDTVLQELNWYISSVGDGSSAASPKPFVFLVTDGAQNNQYQSGGSWWGSNHATTIDPANCATLKSRGITVAVLYIPYVPINNPNSSFANDEDDFANANIPNIPSALSGCASPGWFYTANSPADITAMMQAMFAASISTPRLVR